MDLLGKLRELKDMDNEINRLNGQLKTLREKIKELKRTRRDIEDDIIQYLEEVNKPGVRLGDFYVLRTYKEVRTRKPKNIKERDAAAVLRNYGVRDSEAVLAKVMEAMKGHTNVTPSLSIKRQSS